MNDDVQQSYLRHMIGLEKRRDSMRTLYRRICVHYSRFYRRKRVIENTTVDS